MTIDTQDELFEAYLDFFKTFRTDDGDFKYIDNINRMISEGQRSLIIDYDDLVLIYDTHDIDIASTVTDNPYFAIEIGSEALGEQVKLENPDYYKEIIYDDDLFSIRFLQPPTPIQIRDIRASHVDSLRWLDGLVIRTTEIKTIITEAIYFCIEKQHKNIIKFQDGIYAKPDKCVVESCKSKDFALDPRESKMIDWQIITLQEKPEDLPPGASPKSIACRLVDDIVNIVRPGDRVHLGGIVRTKPTKMIRKGQILTYDMWIDVNFIQSLTKEDQFADISLEEEAMFKELAQDPKIHDRLLDSLAPAIYGMKSVKEAALMMLFGGVDKVFPDGFTTRGASNLLLVGDPGVAKSQILKYVQSIAPRGLYTSGRGSSAAGLTAAIIRDPDTGEITLEAGALVLADRGVCLIDEFDKMNENDRSAIHEAMEQHSYHPSTEIRFADGRLNKIGEFVDSLFEQNPNRSTQGINCEILPISDLKYSVLSTNFENFKPLTINRVSRHPAPDHFIKIKFGNGRDILVTPEHPVYIYNEKILVEDAENIQADMFVPSPRKVEYKKNIKLKTNFISGNKIIHQPSILNLPLIRFLGYFVSEGFSYQGSSYEVGLSNKNPIIIAKMKKCILSSFQINPIDYTERNRTLRLVSKNLFEYLKSNFPELMSLSIHKRIPIQIFSAKENLRIEFLRCAFEGDGSVETETASFSTSSRGLAHDYQDLLATLNIATRISDSEYEYDNNTKRRTRYKVYIRGDSLALFSSIIISSTIKNSHKLRKLVSRSENDNYSRDVLPPTVASKIIKCVKKLGIPYDGTFHQHLVGNYGITRPIVFEYIQILNDRLEKIKIEYQDSYDIKSIRKTVNYSQKKIALLIQTSRGRIDYIERSGYTKEIRDSYLNQVKISINHVLSEVEDDLMYIKKLSNFRWLRVKKVEKIQNEGKHKSEMVYDITIEPTKNFVSQNLILHNTVSIAKAGIVATLNSRTSVMAAANPKYGRYEPHRTFSENVALSPAILSRFDLVFILRDVPDEEHDTVLASHILDLHRHHGTAQVNKPPLNEEMLKKYIAYAKTHYHPTLSEEASDVLEEFYVSMRNTYGKADDDGSSKNRVTITARQLEGTIRLAESRSRAALRNIVTKHDAMMAIQLMQDSLSQIAIDPATGEVDIDSFYSGQTSTKRSKLTKLLSIIDFLYRDAGGKTFREDLLLDEAEREGIDPEYTKGVIQQMLRDGQLYQPKPGFIKRPDI